MPKCDFDKVTKPSRGVLSKRYSENMQLIYRIAPMPKCDFNKVSKSSRGVLSKRCS